MQQKGSDWWIQAITAAFTALAAIFSAWAAHESSRQASSAEDQNRPWLQPTNLKVEVLGYQKAYDNVYMRASLSYKNVGHFPATKVYAYSELLIDPYETFIDDYVPKQVCRRATYPDQFNHINAAFPDSSDLKMTVYA